MLKPRDSFIVAGACLFVASLVAVPGFLLSHAAYQMLSHRNFRFTSREGVVRIISAMTEPQVFWGAALAVSAAAAMMLLIIGVLSIAAIYIPVRAIKMIHNVRNI